MKPPGSIFRKLICTVLFVIGQTSLVGQEPPPPPHNHGSDGNVPGGGAPIAGGIGILLALGAAYGGKKVYDFTLANRRANNE